MQLLLLCQMTQGDYCVSELEEMTDEIRAGIDSGKYTLSDIQRLVTKRGKEAATATDEFVRENPWAALGVAIGCAGSVAAGYLYSRHAKLFTWGSFQAFAAIVLMTLWHAAGLRSPPSESSN